MGKVVNLFTHMIRYEKEEMTKPSNLWSDILSKYIYIYIWPDIMFSDMTNTPKQHQINQFDDTIDLNLFGVSKKL